MFLQIIVPSKYFYQPTWVMVIIVLSLMLIGYLYSAFNSRFNTFIKAVFLSRYSVQASREERSLSHPVSLLLSLNFILTASLFILQLLSSGKLFDSKMEFSLLSYLLIALTVFSTYVVKILFLRTVAFIIDKQEIMAEYNFTIFLMNQFLGVLLIPVIIFIAYGPKMLLVPCLIAGTGLIIVAILLRVGKGLSAALQRKEATLFYLILYLCTLEILPLLIGIKLFDTLTR
jgi:Domain of unknown function (DUF4271)